MRIEDRITMKEHVLILCTSNSARSQMAEGLLRSMAGERFLVYSAGNKPSTVNPFAIQVMRERGIDISNHRSKHLSEFANQLFAYVITVCDDMAENCPIFPGRAQRIHWSINDPAKFAGSDDEKLEVFRQARDAIEQHLTAWLAELPLRSVVN